MFRYFIFAMLLFVLAEKSFAELNTEFFSRGESYSSSDGAALKSYLNKLIGPEPKRGVYVLSRNNLEFGMAWEAWEFSFYHRNDYNLGFHPDTLEFAYKNNNKVAIPLDKEYQVSVVANQYQITGFKLGHEFSLSKTVKLWAAASYIHATESVSGYLGKSDDGSGGFVSKARVQLPFSDKYRVDLNGNLHTDYYFTDDPLFGRDVDPPTGQGYSIDLGASWQARDNLLFELKVSDALGEIRWDGLAHTIADATSDRFIEDEDGVWQAYPSYSGWGLEESFSQDLTRRTRINVHYDLAKYYLGYEYDDMGLAEFHRGIVGYQFSQKWGVKTSLDLERSVIGFTLLAPYGNLYIAFDDLAFDKAHNVGFGWAFSFPL